MTEHMKHEFIGEAQGSALAEWLNRKGHREERERVTALISAIRDLNATLEHNVHANIAKAKEEALRAGQKSLVIGAQPVSRQYLKALRRLDRLLSDCWMRPQLVGHGGKCRFEWLHQKAVSYGVYLVTQLMELGVLDGVRTCARPGCDKWLFVTYPTKRFCSGDCQRREYQTSDEWKRRRRLKYQARRRGSDAKKAK
jgi:hypothetical protein